MDRWPKPASRELAHRSLRFRAGVDVRTRRFLALWGEARDFLTGSRNYCSATIFRWAAQYPRYRRIRSAAALKTRCGSEVETSSRISKDSGEYEHKAYCFWSTLCCSRGSRINRRLLWQRQLQRKGRVRQPTSEPIPNGSEV